MQRLALDVAHGARRLRLLLLLRAPATGTAEFAEHTERILRAVSGVRARRAIAGPHLPGRAMAGDRILLVLRHGVVAHAGEEIVVVVVLAHVVETEPPVFV